MIWTNLGAAYLGNPVLATDAQQQQAIAAFEQALALNPAAPSVAYNIGLIYRDRQENEQAIHWFRRAVQTNPRDKDARRILKRLLNEA
jgi:tetratricopeptide (TPR) repeat protein